ncbi:hypothetical protein ACFL2Q_00515 [Thermodesulfobacteriota bacterium]
MLWPRRARLVLLVLAAMLFAGLVGMGSAEQGKAVRFPSQYPESESPPEVRVGDLYAVVVGVSNVQKSQDPAIERVR